MFVYCCFIKDNGVRKVLLLRVNDMYCILRDADASFILFNACLKIHEGFLKISNAFLINAKTFRKDANACPEDAKAFRITANVYTEDAKAFLIDDGACLTFNFLNFIISVRKIISYPVSFKR